MIQHVNVKIFVVAPESADTAAVPAVFQRWIREGACEELLIDVADYSHVPAGPGVMLIGHEANYSLDNGGGRAGLLYNRKASVEGSDEDRVAQALQAALAASRRLKAEPEFGGRLDFDEGRFEIVINDRALAPNDDATFEALKPAIEGGVGRVFGPGGLRFERVSEARERLRVAVALER
jgi:hypothetical protein